MCWRGRPRRVLPVLTAVEAGGEEERRNFLAKPACARCDWPNDSVATRKRGTKPGFCVSVGWREGWACECEGVGAEEGLDRIERWGRQKQHQWAGAVVVSR
ncbi:hypothetical protein EX30DRAFT_211871 [Ascodesmis nigricans]|uniref:Uncharacterized protein n=1 Tax=Ascodesmis nigricans TaxID=341454 RepID=A0A4S2MP42_9PEZI|nr:hypothetical protein EX30DRAFT_211871 [Ascodesmis nigricans]